MGKRDIYGHEEKLKWWTRKITDSDFEEETKKEILDFFNYCSATALSVDRILFYANRLYPLARMLKKPFKQATRAEIETVVAEIERNDKLSAATKGIYRVTLKKLYKWLEGNGTVYPEKVAWIKTQNGIKKMLPEDLLTKEDVDKLVDAAENPRDKAFIAVLYESGCRIGEIASLQLKCVSFDEYGAVLIVDGKTGMRRVRLISSVHLLTSWLGYHMDRQNPNAYLWIKLTRQRGKPLDYDAIRIQIFKIARKAGVKKRVNPHSFRHARATELARLGLNQAQMSAYLGWVPDTNMAATYIHLSGADLDNALLSAYGMKKPDDEGNKPKCPRCFKPNTIEARFCTACGMPMSLRAAVETDDENKEFRKEVAGLKELLKDTEVKAFLASKMNGKH